MKEVKLPPIEVVIEENVIEIRIPHLSSEERQELFRRVEKSVSMQGIKRAGRPKLTDFYE